MTMYLKNLRFPIYPLPKNEYRIEQNKILVTMPSMKEYILDDKSLPGDTLGIRRLQIDKDKLYPLKKSINDVGNFLLYTKLYKQFLDSNGRFFKYEAKTKVPLIYRKIVHKIPYKGGTMLSLDKIHCPIWYYRDVEPDKEYAALLRIERGYLILALTVNSFPDSTYKI